MVINTLYININIFLFKKLNFSKKQELLFSTFANLFNALFDRWHLESHSHFCMQSIVLYRLGWNRWGKSSAPRYVVEKERTLQPLWKGLQDSRGPWVTLWKLLSYKVVWKNIWLVRLLAVLIFFFFIYTCFLKWRWITCAKYKW